MPKFSIKVEFIVPVTTGDVEDGFSGYAPTREQALEYVKEAVQTYGGQRHPTDPFFNVEEVKVV